MLLVELAEVRVPVEMLLLPQRNAVKVKQQIIRLGTVAQDFPLIMLLVLEVLAAVVVLVETVCLLVLEAQVEEAAVAEPEALLMVFQVAAESLLAVMAAVAVYLPVEMVPKISNSLEVPLPVAPVALQERVV